MTIAAEPDNSVLKAALWYAGVGWPVFPLHSIQEGRCTCGSGDCGKSAGKHPRTAHGLKDATTDADQIRRWWARSPESNIGIATGAAAGFMALDVDPRGCGDELLWELERQHGELPATVISLTGGGGAHLLFKHAEGLKNQAGEIGPGLDLKTDGGYIVAPPSMHLSGRRYCWEGSSRPGEVSLASAPAWLLELARRAKANENGNGGGAAKPVDAKILHGQRNSTLASLAGSMRRRGMAAPEIEAALVAVNQRRCDPPLPPDEVHQIAESVGRYEPKAPAAPRQGRVEERALTVPEVPSIRSFAGVKVDWVVDELFAESTVNLLAGDSGVGKTTLALACAGAVVAGKPFLGRRTARRPVLVLDRENPLAVVLDRFDRLGIEDGEQFKVWGGWLEQQAPDPASATVQTWIASCDPRPLVVVDSLVAFHPGAENDAAETREYMHHYRRLAHLGATILLVHHTGKGETSREYRGSSDIKAAVDAAYHLSSLSDNAGMIDRLRLRAFKTRFAGKTDILLRYTDDRFETEEESRYQGRTNTALLTELLRANPGIMAADFQSKAAEKGLGRNRGRAFLQTGLRSGRVRIEIGEHNARRHYLVEGIDEGLFPGGNDAD